MGLDVLLAVVAAVAALWIACLVLFWLARPKGVPVRAVVAVHPGPRCACSARSWPIPPPPLDVRVVLVLLVAWIVSPIDLIPEFIPVLGPIDDVVVAVAALRYVRRRVGMPELRARWTGSDEGFALVARVMGGEVGPGGGPE